MLNFGCRDIVSTFRRVDLFVSTFWRVEFFVSTFRRVEFFVTTLRHVEFSVLTFRRIPLIRVQFKFTVFSVMLPACIVVRCRVIVSSYLRVELVGVESNHHRFLR